LSVTARSTAQRVANSRREAIERLGGRYDARVLEPSPPAVTTAPWFADDPVEVGPRDPHRKLVSPVTTGDLLWDEVARADERLAGWCAERWLGAYARLPPAPGRLRETRLALHALAEHVISPVRRRANGKIGLRYTLGGFGTPFFGNDAQVRVAADVITVQLPDSVQSGRLTSLSDAAEFVGLDLARLDAADAAQPLDIDVQSARFLGDWFGFAASVLEQLRAEAEPVNEPGRVQLWPEHFDMAVELGSEPAGRRAGYGCSPGDETHPEPYLYVAPWNEPPAGELWQARAFRGAELPLQALLEAADQRATALAFLRACRDALEAA
jgi:hypothetical protein